jgi:hypothetical protein
LPGFPAVPQYFDHSLANESSVLASANGTAGRDPDLRVPNSKRIETARCPQMERLHRRFVIVLGKALASRYARSRWGGAGVDVTAKRLLGRGQTAHTGTARQGFGGEHR